MTATKLDCFTRQYVATALWSSNDNNSDPLDSNYSDDDFAPQTRARVQADCAAFQERADEIINAADDTGECRRGPDCDTAWERAGHDFWLTRNGHGAGFWDGDWPEPYATQLDDIAKSFGECDLYVGDDGKLYIVGAE